MYAVPCCSQNRKTLTSAGSSSAASIRGLAQETLLSIPEGLLVPQGAHADIAVRHALGKLGGQILLDGDLAL